MPNQHANFAYSTVATAPSPASSGTSLTLQTGDGAKFPQPPFSCTVWPVSTNPLTTNAEIVTVTAVSGDTFTITRQAENTSARTIVIGDQVANTATVQTFTDVENPAVAPSRPSADTVIIGNSITLLYDDPYDPWPGVLTDVQSGALLVLGAGGYNDGWSISQTDPEPKENVRLFGGNQSAQFGSDFPLIMDSGFCYELDSGSVLLLDSTPEDTYSGIVNNRPGRAVTVPDNCVLDTISVYILDSGILLILAGPSSTDGTGSLLSVS